MSYAHKQFDSLAIDASRADVLQATGTEWYSREIINAIARSKDRPDVSLYRRHGVTGQVAPGVTSRPVRLSRLWTHVGLSAAMIKDQPDALFVPAHVVPVYHPATTVVTIHDLGYLVEPDSHPKTRQVVLDATTRWNVWAATRIIAISQQTKSDLVRHYGADPNNIDVIHHGINHGKFHPMNDLEIAPVLDHYGISAPYLLFLSSVQPRKNVRRLVEAFAQLADPKYQLVIAGQTGWFGDDIEQFIAQHEDFDRIHRLGYVAGLDVPALYAGASLFALPSLYEGFGMGILEAMACGCPVVTSNLSSMPEVAGGAAMLIDPHSSDAIAEGISLALVPGQHSMLAKKGIERAKEFTWKKAAEQTLRSISRAYNDQFA